MRKVAYFIFVFLFFSDDLAFASGITIDLGFDDIKNNSTLFTSKIVQFIGLITVLSIAPSILIMVTSFTKVAIVLSFLRSALGLQQTPPNMVLTSLSLFLTFFIMSSTFHKAYEDGLAPLMNNTINEEQAWNNIIKPFHGFMLKNTGEKEIQLFLDIAKLEIGSNDEMPLHILIPAFMISELKRAFEIGFLIFLPFLIIDMLMASVLMAMGMMMVPPAMIALPFKLIFFVLIDGWYMICGSLVKSYGIT